MTKTKLEIMLEKHKLWVNCSGGKCANLHDENLRYKDLRYVDLSNAVLRGADLCGVDLSHAVLRNAYLHSTDLSGAVLCGADLSGTDLSGARGLLSAVDFLKTRFECTDEGHIAYKVFGAQYEQPKEWEIVPGAILTETVNPDRCTECGSGINVAPLDWVKKLYPAVKPIWKVLIKWEWLPGVIVPYMTDGKIRCEKVQLIGTVGCVGEADE